MQLTSKVAATLAVLFLCLFTADVYLEYRQTIIGVDAVVASVKVSPGDVQSNLPQQPSVVDERSLDSSLFGQQISSRAKEQILTDVKQRSIFYAMSYMFSLILLTWLLNKSLLTPIARLKQVSQELARGNYLAATSLPEHDQLTHVSYAFKSMAG
jgi:HAMP domain-containing protein